MRRFRVGIVDVSAAVLVLIVIVMPARDMHVASGYRYVEPADRPALVNEVAHAQAQVLARPGDGAAVEALAALLAARPAGQHDQAMRLAGEAAKTSTPTTWRALLAISIAHADRIEIPEALRFANQALQACEAPGAACPEHEKVRLGLYAEQLTAGTEAIARGADPRAEPERFRREMSSIHPTTTFRVRSGAGE